LTNELSELRRRGDEQRASLEKKSVELEKQVTELSSDLFKVNSDLSKVNNDLFKVNNDLRDSSANYELRIETLETKLNSSNACLQVTRTGYYLVLNSVKSFCGFSIAAQSMIGYRNDGADCLSVCL